MEQEDQKNNTEVYEFIKRNPCGVLGTLGDKKEIDVAHIYVFTDLVLHGYFVSKIDTRKINNLEKNPHVTILFADRDALQQVEYKGTAEILTAAKEILTYYSKIQEIIAAQRNEFWTPPVTQTPGEGYAIVKIVPTSILYRDYAREDKDSGPHEFFATPPKQ